MTPDTILSEFKFYFDDDPDKKRKQKHIDRIAWKAAAAQRFAKGGHWK